MLITKEILKKEIDKLPVDKLEKAYKLLSTIRNKKPNGKKIATFKLGGKYDNMNIREYAYRKDSN